MEEKVMEKVGKTDDDEDDLRGARNFLHFMCGILSSFPRVNTNFWNVRFYVLTSM